MPGAWTFTGQIAAVGGLQDTVTLVEETTFCLSDRAGDSRAGAAHGLIYLDTRFVSTLELRVDGQPVEPLGSAIDHPFAATFVGRVTPPGTEGDTPLGRLLAKLPPATPFTLDGVVGSLLGREGEYTEPEQILLFIHQFDELYVREHRP